MAKATVVGGFTIPAPVPYASVPAYVSALLDVSGERFGVLFRAPKTGTLDKVEFRTGAVTTFPTNGIRVGFRAVNLATGDPTTADPPPQYRDITVDPGANTWTVPGLMTSDGTDTGTKRSVTQGELVYMTIEQVNTADAWSMNIVGLDEITAGGVGSITSSGEEFLNNPIATKTVDLPCFALKYNDGTYPHVVGYGVPWSTLGTLTFKSDSTPDEVALFFRFAAPVTVRGCWFRVDLDGDATIRLYDSDGSTVLASSDLDANVRVTTGPKTFWVQFNVDVDLLANTDYRLSILPTTLTSIVVYQNDVNSAAIMDGIEGGQDFKIDSRTDGGAWQGSPTSTRRPECGLLLNKIDNGAGGAGGGLLVHPGMSGGCRG